MILDALTTFSDAQSSTLAVASTDIIDTLAAGDSYEGCWFVARVDTAFTKVGAPTVVFQLQTCADSDFGTSAPVSLCVSASYVAANLVAGKFVAMRIPHGAKRYLRGYKVITVYNGVDYWTAAVYDMFIVKDIDANYNQRYMLP